MVTPASLRAAGIVKSTSMPVKILGDGEISVALDISAERFSGSARAKIEAAGGKVTELAPKVVEDENTPGKKAGRRRAGAKEALSHTADAAAAPVAEAPATSQAEAEAPAAADSTEKEAED